MINLLDTHALLWALTEPERLGKHASEVLRDRTSTLVVSAVSALEIATKQRLGKLPRANALISGYVRHVDRLRAIRLPVTDDHALLAGQLEWTHRDPFDRLLAAQAIHEDLALVTKDPVFSDMPGVVTLW